MKQNAGILFTVWVVMRSGVFNREGKRKYLTTEEGRRFRVSAERLSPRQAAFCLTVYYTGCRISEALELTSESIDLESNVVIIRTLKQRDDVVYRRVPIPPELIHRLSCIKQPSALDRLWKMSRTSAWRLIKQMMTESGIEGIHGVPKGLRHGFGVRAVLMKVPPNIIQSWLGHKDFSNTSIYLDVKGEEEIEFASRTWH